jgi:Ser/Thr protein kinase RdoA (MazF antagonist)
MEIKKALLNWNISYENIRQIYKSAWQIGEKYILKTGNNLHLLNSNLAIINNLHEQNIPVAEIVKTVNGLDYVVIDNTYFFLSKKISGEHITDIYAGDYNELSYLIGEIIGKLHMAFRICQERISCHDNNFYNEITGWISQTIKDKNIISVPTEILDECVSEMKYLYPKLPRQLIHRDIHLGNMLFQNNTLTGYIDFDLSQINARIFDLCYMALGFLIDNIEDENKTAKWFLILQKLVKGYCSIIPLTCDEKQAMPTMMIAIEMLFIAFFTNNNDKKGADDAKKMLIWLWENKDRIHKTLDSCLL